MTKRAVTLPQARRWPASEARRRSFCARMAGMRRELTGERAAADPASPINRALAAWDCDRPALLARKDVTKGIRMPKTARKPAKKPAGNPARKPARKPAAKPTVSKKISQLRAEGYPQQQAIAVALEEQRRGKVRAPRKTNPTSACSLSGYAVHQADQGPQMALAWFPETRAAVAWAKAWANRSGAQVAVSPAVIVLP